MFLFNQEYKVNVNLNIITPLSTPGAGNELKFQLDDVLVAAVSVSFCSVFLGDLNLKGLY